MDKEKKDENNYKYVKVCNVIGKIIKQIGTLAVMVAAPIIIDTIKNKSKG
ncbi:MAG: hypothetical protein K0S71_346 [Clostridia bacterium]|nr:hypothetical protein [Clostridia bacterium]